MIVKLFEIRDDGTCIPAMAMLFDRGAVSNEAERWLLDIAGYSRTEPTIVVARIDGAADRHLEFDPYEWRSNTMREAHLHIEECFDDLEPGAVIDVRCIRGEREVPVRSDRFGGTP